MSGFRGLATSRFAGNSRSCVQWRGVKFACFGTRLVPVLVPDSVGMVGSPLEQIEDWSRHQRGHITTRDTDAEIGNASFRDNSTAGHTGHARGARVAMSSPLHSCGRNARNAKAITSLMHPFRASADCAGSASTYPLAKPGPGLRSRTRQNHCSILVPMVGLHRSSSGRPR
jgi:hypothetical protein